MLIRISVFFLIILSQYAYAVETKVLYEGYTDKIIEKTVYRSSDELDDLREQTGIKDKADIPEPGRDKIVAVISSDKSYYPSLIKIKGIETDRNGNYKIFYKVLHTPTVAEKNVEDKKKRPFVLLEVSHEGIGSRQITAINQDLKDVVVIDNSINQDIKYSNVLKNQENYLFIEYFPLDKGNSWTYEKSMNGKTDKLEFEITSFAEGWSVFDNFFGKYNVGFRIDNEGELLVSTKIGIKPFYNKEVEINEMNKTVAVGAGKFDQILVVKSPVKEGFTFRDIYVKDVGLVYHEHSTPSGTVKYSLVSAKVRGKSLP